MLVHSLQKTITANVIIFTFLAVVPSVLYRRHSANIAFVVVEVDVFMGRVQLQMGGFLFYRSLRGSDLELLEHDLINRDLLRFIHVYFDD